jgi:hypothetical protein
MHLPRSAGTDAHDSWRRAGGNTDTARANYIAQKGPIGSLHLIDNVMVTSCPEVGQYPMSRLANDSGPEVKKN